MGWVEPPSPIDEEAYIQLPWGSIAPLNPDSLPDLTVSFHALGRSGEPCYSPGQIITLEEKQRFSIENEGNGTAPNSFKILRRSQDSSKSLFALNFVRGLEPGESVPLRALSGDSELILDPNNEIAEVDETNNNVRLGGSPESEYICQR